MLELSAVILQRKTSVEKWQRNGKTTGFCKSVEARREANAQIAAELMRA
jgi:hypothetical protein